MIRKIRKAFSGLITKTEKYTKTDTRYVLSGGFWLFLGQGLIVLGSLGLAVAFANLIEPEKYGNYKYVLSLASVVSVFTLSGLTTAVTRGAARGFPGTLPYAYRTSLIWSVGMVIIALIGAAYYFYRDNTFLGTSLLIIGATAPIITATSLYRPFLMGTERFKRASLFGIFQSLTPTLAVLGGLLLNAPLIFLVGIYFGSNALILIVLYYQVRKSITELTPDPNTNRLGKHLSIMGIISTIASRLDSILIFQLLGGTELAIFTLATSIPDTVKGSLKNLDTLAMPRFSQKNRDELRSGVLRKILLITIGTTILALLYILAAPTIFETLFPKYLNAVPFTQIYALIIPMSLALASAFFDSQAAVKERYVLNITNNTTKILFAVVGIYFFGLWGAILARLLARFINILLSLFFISRA